MLNIKSLLAFQAIVQEGSASAAADKLAMSNPGVSRHIQTLEHQLKMRLFHRTRRRLVLTEEGARFYAETERILRNISELPNIARDIRSSVVRSMRVIAMPRHLGPIVSPAIAEFRKQFRETKMTVEILRRSKLGEWIEGRGFDVGFGTLPLDEQNLEVLPVFRTPLMVAMRADDALAGAEVVTPHDLSKRGQIALPRGSIPRRQSDEVMQSAGREATYTIETTDFAFACHHCMHSGDLFLVDPISASSFAPNLVCRPLWTKRWISFGAFLRLDSRRSDAIDALIDLVEARSVELINRGLAESIRKPKKDA